MLVVLMKSNYDSTAKSYFPKRIRHGCVAPGTWGGGSYKTQPSNTYNVHQVDCTIYNGRIVPQAVVDSKAHNGRIMSKYMLVYISLHNHRRSAAAVSFQQGTSSHFPSLHRQMCHGDKQPSKTTKFFIKQTPSIKFRRRTMSITSNQRRGIETWNISQLILNNKM